MDVRGKLVELIEPHMSGLACEYESGSCELTSCRLCNARNLADHLIANGVTVQECKVAEIDQFKLPINDAILILKEEYKQRVDGYDTHLSYDGKGDPAEEVYLDALGMAIAALEWQNRTLPQPVEGE